MWLAITNSFLLIGIFHHFPNTTWAHLPPTWPMSRLGPGGEIYCVFLVFFSIFFDFPQQTPNLAPHIPKIGRPDRRNMPKIGPRSANTGQDEPRMQPTTRQTYPKIYESASTRISKTGNPIQKLNSNADNAKEPHNNISKTPICPVFSHGFRDTCERHVQAIRSSNLTRLAILTYLRPIWAYLPAILGPDDPFGPAMFDRLDVILDRSNGYISHMVQFLGR